MGAPLTRGVAHVEAQVQILTTGPAVSNPCCAGAFTGSVGADTAGDCGWTLREQVEMLGVAEKLGVKLWR